MVENDVMIAFPDLIAELQHVEHFKRLPEADIRTIVAAGRAGRDSSPWARPFSPKARLCQECSCCCNGPGTPVGAGAARSRRGGGRRHQPAIMFNEVAALEGAPTRSPIRRPTLRGLADRTRQTPPRAAAHHKVALGLFKVDGRAQPPPGPAGRGPFVLDGPGARRLLYDLSAGARSPSTAADTPTTSWPRVSPRSPKLSPAP